MFEMRTKSTLDLDEIGKGNKWFEKRKIDKKLSLVQLYPSNALSSTVLPIAPKQSSNK
jgi:hypothetical protein